MKAIGHQIQKLIKPIAQKQGFDEVRVLTRWPEIVGPALAKNTAPTKLTNGNLVIAVTDGATAMEVTHRSTQICEAVNSWMGYCAATRVVTEQTLSPKTKE
jgi:hypothetical protein